MSTALIPNPPEPPRLWVDTTWRRPAGIERRCATAAEFAAALLAAQPGDIIVMLAGAVFAGSFTLAVKPDGNFIYIVSSALDALPPPGAQVNPSHAGAMAKIVTLDTRPAIRAAARSHRYRLAGLELAVADGVALNYGVVFVGANDETQTTIDDAPSDITIDRSIVRGNATGDVQYGVGLQAVRGAVVGCYIYEIHADGFQCQAVVSVNGPGPLKVTGSELQATGENLMIGGARPSIPGLVPADIEIGRNNLLKLQTWNPKSSTYAGKKWACVNNLELKNARRVVARGNTYDGSWTDVHTGESVKVTSTANKNNTAPWSVTEDVLICDGIIRNAEEGFALEARANNPSDYTKRVEIRNMLLDGIYGKRAFYISSPGEYLDPATGVLDKRGIEDLNIHHVTSVNTNTASGLLINVAHGPLARFRFSDNVGGNGKYGIKGSAGEASGMPTINKYFPGAEITGNAIVGGKPAEYPPGNVFFAAFDEARLMVGPGADEAAIQRAMDPPPPEDDMAEIARLTAALATMTAERDALTVSLRDAEFNVSALEGMNLSLNADLRDTQGEVSALEGRVEGLKMDLTAAETASASLQSRLDAVSVELVAMTEDRDAERAEISRLEAGIAAAEAALAALVA